MLYWQRVRLTDAMEGWRRRDPRAAIIPNDPFGYGFPTGPYDRDNAIEETLVGLNAEVNQRIAGTVVQLWTLGGEWSGNRTRQYAGGADNCPRLPARLPAPFGPRPCALLHTNQADMPQVNGNQWALWVQNEILFVQGRYALVPLVRYDHYQQRPQQSRRYAANPNVQGLPPAASDGRFSPTLLGSWHAQEQLTLYAQYGYGFKAPSATQLYMNYGGAGTYLRLGNPFLKPEISKGAELGAKVGNEESGATFSLFDNRYQNFIDNKVLLGPTSPTWQPAWATQYPLGVYGTLNRARVRIYGTEASARWKFAPGWRVWTSLAWAVGKDESSGQYLNTVAPLKAVLGLRHDRERWGVSALFTAAARRNKVAHPEATAPAPYADFQAPGYGTVDLMGYWLPAPIKGLRVQGGVFNLFNKKYWEAINVPTAGNSALPRPVDGYTEPGRSVRIALTYQL
jgi:hemoglobin/transferrin/lactoferrin receptor protein